MNIIKRLHTKWLIGREFKKEFVNTGYVHKNFSVKWDKEKQDFYVMYTPINVRRLEDIGEPEIFENNKKIVEEYEY